MPVNTKITREQDNIRTFESDSSLDFSLYNVHSRPNVKRSAPILPQDVLEPTQIKKEAFERLTNSMMSDSLHATIMRMAKYIFVAVAWPPYALFFELPKYIFIKLTPPFKNLFVKITGLAKKQVKAISDYFFEPLFAFASKMVAAVVNPVSHFVHKVKEKFTRIAEKTKMLLNRSSEKLKSFFSVKVLTKPIVQITKKLRQKAVEFGRAIRVPFEKIAKLDLRKMVMSVLPTESFQKLQQLPAVFLGWAVNLSIVQQTLHSFVKAQGLAELGTNKFMKVVSSVIITPLSTLLKAFQVASKKVTSLLSSYLRKGFGFFGEKARDLGEWVKDKCRLVFRLKTLHLIFPPFLYTWIPEYIRKAIVLFFRWLIASPPFRIIMGGIRSIGRFLVELPQKIKDYVRAKFLEIQEYFKRAVGGTKRSIAIGVKKFGWLCNRVVYWTFTLVIMSGIIADWGLNLLKRISNQVFRHNHVK